MIERYFPNLLQYQQEFITSIKESLLMMGYSSFFVLIIGLVLGTSLLLTEENKLWENKSIHYILDKLINVFRSIPFVILITFLIPISRRVVGTPLGVKGAIIPLIVASSPFYARQVYIALSEVEEGLIDAALSMGLNHHKIIIHVYWREALASLIHGYSITLISLFSLTTISGTMGAGGLGAFVQRYGHARMMMDITIASLIVIILFVSLIQTISNLIINLLLPN